MKKEHYLKKNLSDYPIVKYICNYEKGFSLSEQIKDFSVTIRISSLKQLDLLEQKQSLLKKIFSIEYGAIAKTEDLLNYDIFNIAEKINTFCKKYNLNFLYATPEILLTRDFDRVYNDVKKIVQKLKPYSVVINNDDFLFKIFNDFDFNKIKIETGNNINIEKISDFPEIKSRIHGVDLSFLEVKEQLSDFLQKQKLTKKRKYIIAGRKKILINPKCPLNDTKEKKSGLYCSSPCTKNHYALNIDNKIYPFITDGFCNLHLYDKDILNFFNEIEFLKKTGITDFIADISGVEEETLLKYL